MTCAPFNLGSLPFILFAGLALGGCSGEALSGTPWSQAPSQWKTETLTHDGLAREFRYYQPSNLPDNAPVVILFHGGLQSMEAAFLIGGTREWPVLAEEEGFWLIVPNGTNAETGAPSGDYQNWNDCRPGALGVAAPADDIGFVSKLITWAENHSSVDARRIYVTGSSNGGMMSYRVAQEMGDRIAAAAAFIANEPANSACESLGIPVPMMIVNGTDDPLMPYEGGEIVGDRGEVISTAATVNYWLEQNNLTGSIPKKEQLPNLNRRDGSEIVRYQYSQGEGRQGEDDQASAPVVLYEMDGGGHTMPSRQHAISRTVRQRITGPQNRDMEGAREAWTFFQQYQLQQYQFQQYQSVPDSSS